VASASVLVIHLVLLTGFLVQQKRHGLARSARSKIPVSIRSAHNRAVGKGGGSRGLPHKFASVMHALVTAEVEKGRSALSIPDKATIQKGGSCLLGLIVQPFSCDYAGQDEESTSGH
jgi:hypothetical protein